MTLITRVITLFVLLWSSAAMALNGSNAFVCDILKYSEDPGEVHQATNEASKRGICGYAKPDSGTESEAIPKTDPKARREKAGKAVLLGGAIVCIAKGKCEQPLTSSSK
jgi:hypothetical protein